MNIKELKEKLSEIELEFNEFRKDMIENSRSKIYYEKKCWDEVDIIVNGKFKFEIEKKVKVFAFMPPPVLSPTTPEFAVDISTDSYTDRKNELMKAIKVIGKYLK